MACTIAVSKVTRATKQRPALDRAETFQSLLHQPIEALSESSGRLVTCDDTNPLVMAAHDAFFEHRPWY